MKKSMAKVLASALSLAMAVTLVTPFSVSAASAPKFAKTYSNLYSKAVYTVKNVKKGYKVKVTVTGSGKSAVKTTKSGKKVSTIKATGSTVKFTATVKASATTANKGATVTAVVYNSKGKKVKTLKDGIRVKAHTTKISASAPETVKVNEKVQIKTKLTPSYATDAVKYKVSGDGATVSSKGVFVATKAGAYAVTVTSNGKKTVVPIVVGDVTNNNADKIEVTLTNAVDGYDDVVLTSTKALLQAVVTLEGKPVSNAVVVFSTANGTSSNVKVAEATTVVTTDANGVATAVITDNQDSVLNAASAGKITATVVGSDVKAESSIRFAGLSVGGVTVATPAAIECGTNATTAQLNDAYGITKEKKVAGTAKTNSLSGDKHYDGDTQYVVSNQVSNKGATNHQVRFDSTIQMVLPASVGETSAADYKKEVNNTPIKQDTYSEKEIWIKDVDAGLQYATLNFSSISLSKYNSLVIETYKGTTLLKTYTMKGEATQNNFGYQLPVQNDAKIDVRVYVKSAGQVQDTKNAGFVIKDVTGVYKTNSAKDGEKVTLPGASISWSKVDAVYSEIKPLKNTADANGLDITDLVDANVRPGDTTKYDYTYQVPVFPYTGDAVITETEKATGKVSNYYLYPTCKVVAGKDENTNVLDSRVVDVDGTEGNVTGAFGAIGFRATSDEVKTTKSVGTVDTNTLKNSVLVNSEEAGTTSLRGDITIPGIDKDVLDATNNKVYTSVQWAPLPKTESSDKFFALAGQSVTVTAQLVDKNGNKQSEKGTGINWNYDELKNDPNKATATKSLAETTTDVNGQAKLVLTGANKDIFAKGVSATSGNSQYDVVLYVADKTVSSADIYWVQAGPSFTDKAEYDQNGPVKDNGYGYGITTTSLSGTKSVKDKAVYVAGDSWYVGFECVGAYKDSTVDASGNVTKNKVTVSGASISTTLGAGSTATAENTKNGELKVTSSKVGNSLVTASMDPKCVTNNIEFIVGGTSYKNAGSGQATGINAKLTLPVYFGNNGMTAVIESPEGSVIATKNGIDNEYVYVKVTDSLGNPVNDKTVNYTLDYSKTDASDVNTAASKIAASVGNGYYQIDLGAGDTEETVTIAATIKDSTLTVSPLTINFVDTTKNTTVNPDVKNVTTAKVGNNYVVNVEFTQALNLNTVKKEQFTVKVATKSVAIKDVTTSTASPSSIVLTLGDNVDLSKLVDGNKVEVTIKPSATVDGVQYYLIDTDGRAVKATNNKSYDPVNSYSVVSLIEDTANNKVVATVEKNSEAVTKDEGNVFFVTDTDIIAGKFENNTYTATIGYGDGEIRPNTSVTVYVNGITKPLVVTGAKAEAANQELLEVKEVVAKIETDTKLTTYGKDLTEVDQVNEAIAKVLTTNYTGYTCTVESKDDDLSDGYTYTVEVKKNNTTVKTRSITAKPAL